jgi:hypothetical protein
MQPPIENIEDLRAEIARIRLVEREQAVALGRRFSSPLTSISTLLTIFPKPAEGEKGAGLFNHEDIISLLSRFLLPITLNKTLFRNSNFLVKALVGIVSQRAAQFINEDSISGIVGKVKSLFKRDKSDEMPEHRAIPALSETS